MSLSWLANDLTKEHLTILTHSSVKHNKETKLLCQRQRLKILSDRKSVFPCLIARIQADDVLPFQSAFDVEDLISVEKWIPNKVPF